jgi:hypothetical protein
MKQNSAALPQLLKRHGALRVFSDNVQTRLCHPIASGRLVFRQSSSPVLRSAGELLEIVEAALGGKFQLPVEAAPEKALEPASGRSADHVLGPVATLEIWSLEPGSYDLVLKLPNALAQNDAVLSPLVTRFVDQAREIARVVGGTDLLRFRGGPSLTPREAHARFNRLEIESGTRLDAENLLILLGRDDKNLLN